MSFFEIFDCFVNCPKPNKNTQKLKTQTQSPFTTNPQLMCLDGPPGLDFYLLNSSLIAALRR